MSLNVHRFAAIRGKQSGDDYFTVVCEMALIPKLFLFNESTIPTELRAQRHINKGRIPEMARYIVDNPKNYIFSALTASIDGDIKFKPLKIDNKESEVGELEIAGDAKLMINDGQHRRAAIEKALTENPDLRKDSVAVVFFKDKGLKKSQQMFSDLNRHAIRPSNSIARLYDHRDPVAEIIRRVVYETEVFKGVVEMERSTITERSSKLFPFSGIYSASKNLIEENNWKKINKEVSLVGSFWETVGEQMDQWRGVRLGNLIASEVRRDYINSHVIILQALGVSGKDLINKFPSQWKSKLKNLKKINWLKNNPIWNNRVLVNGRVVKNNTSIILASNVIKKALGLSLNSKEKLWKVKLRKMENKKRKSFFDELGFKPTIEKLIDHIAKLYLEDNIPWIVGYSGGKDSSACVQLLWKVLEKLKAEKKEIKPLYVITTDTLVENPIVSLWVKTSLDLLKDKAKEKGLPVFPNLLTPNISETFFVNLIGKGYPAPNTKFRWCTERMKIRPSDRFLRKISSESGEAILVVGTRRAESSNRAQSIKKFEEEATRENFNPHVNLSNISSFSYPLKIGAMMMFGCIYFKKSRLGELIIKICYLCIKEQQMVESARL